MIAKITYGSSIYGAVSYNHNKIEEGTAKIICTHNMISNQDKQLTLSQTLRSFEDYLQANNRTKTPVAHFSLNPSPEDKLDDGLLKELAKEYMEKMGYGNQPYIVYKHNDISREHIHIVSVRVDETGKKINDSHDYINSMAICRDLELKYNLQPVRNESKEDLKLYLKKIDYEKGDVKRQIANILKTVTKNYKFQGFGEFNALLSSFNIHSKIVKGEEEGNLYHGIIYSATNDEGKLLGNPIKSSLIGKFSGYDSLNKLINKESKKVKPEDIESSKIKSIVSSALQLCGSTEQFISELRKHHIDTIFRQNEKGRIYGVTFVDHDNKLVMNGSRLGKDFSANVFNEHFNPNSQQKIDLKENIDISNTEYNRFDHIPTIPLDDIFGVFHSHADSSKDDQRLKKKKKKKKKGKNI